MRKVSEQIIEAQNRVRASRLTTVAQEQQFTIAKHVALEYDGVQLNNGARLEVDPGTQIIQNDEGTGLYALAWVYLPNERMVQPYEVPYDDSEPVLYDTVVDAVSATVMKLVQRDGSQTDEAMIRAEIALAMNQIFGGE